MARMTRTEQLRARLLGFRPTDVFWGWAGPVFMAVVGGLMRFWSLGRPDQLVFDLELAIVVGIVHRCSQVGSCARAIRNLAKQRPRVGPMLPCGIPSALANSA